MNYSGLFITFEGPDGAGKTTQIQRLAQALTEQGHRVVSTREPGGTPISDQIRSLLLAPDHQEMNGQAEALLMAAARAQHVHQLILPELQAGAIVLCDRFVDASMAYQAAGLGLGLDGVRQINEFATGGITPNRTYLLDISVQSGRNRLLQRMKQAGDGQLDRIEQKDLDYHQRVREAFLQIAKLNPERVCRIEADQPAEIIQAVIRDDCWTVVNKWRESSTKTGGR